MKIKRSYLKEKIKQLNAENATLKLWLSTISDLTPTDRVNRLEILDEFGKHYIKRDVDIVELQLDNNYKTLKIFIKTNKA